MFSDALRPHLSVPALLLLGSMASAEVGAIAPKFLIDSAALAAKGQVAATADGLAAISLTKNDITVTIRGGEAAYPGLCVTQASGVPWDLSPWGHVEARISNLGAESVTVGMRVDNAGDWKLSPWSAENLVLAPGESKVLKVIFGCSYGFKPSYRLDPAKVTQLLIMAVGKTMTERKLRIEDVQAAGPAGEGAPADPGSVHAKPEHGLIFVAGAAIDVEKQLAVRGGAKATIADGAIHLDLVGDAASEAIFKPAFGSWNLCDYLQVAVTLKNLGVAPAAPRLRLESTHGPSDAVIAPAIAPGAETTVVIPFVAMVPTVIPAAPRQERFGPGAWNEQNWGPMPGTGTSFVSTWADGVSVLGGSEEHLAITRISAGTPATSTPVWLGKRPPVPEAEAGNWTPTFAEEFDHPLDHGTWNIYTSNFWDKRTHFSKDEVIVAEGKLTLRYEKKRGPHNDDPSDAAIGTTEHAAGFADTYGKWVQRYGYFEARMKLPTAPGLWPAFWMVPDRGADRGEQWKRANTADGGMEFDILEYLSGWGPYRYNLALHWDGYGKEHKSAGSVSNYVRPDADGYITAGLLWTPGSAIYYAQGREMLRWESPRVSSVPSYLILNVVSGGWDNEPLDDARLPADFVIDYVRAWQRKDLASQVDGHKANAGLPRADAPSQPTK